MTICTVINLSKAKQIRCIFYSRKKCPKKTDILDLTYKVILFIIIVFEYI